MDEKRRLPEFDWSSQPKVVVTTSGVYRGDGVTLIGRTCSQLVMGGWSAEAIREFQFHCLLQPSYDHLLNFVLRVAGP